MTSSNNPAAFPVTGIDPWKQTVVEQFGMTLRDYYAGKAIGAVIRQCAADVGFGYPEGIESMEQYFAVKAYAIADAMIAARSVRSETDV